MIKLRCPICKQQMPGPAADWPEYPFCSPRCRKIDLGRWLGERYRLPVSDEQQTSADETDE